MNARKVHAGFDTVDGEKGLLVGFLVLDLGLKRRVSVGAWTDLFPVPCQLLFLDIFLVIRVGPRSFAGGFGCDQLKGCHGRVRRLFFYLNSMFIVL